MRHVLLILGVTALVGANGAEAAQDEVLRLGDTVQHVGGDPGHDLFVRVMGQPADDIDKWFISVIVMKNCPACVKLKQDWAKDACLLALAKPDDPQASWAHFNWYDKDDASQMWRFREVRITAYPTILVQPPRSNKYGDPSIVVYQATYGGNPHKLATAITDAIRRYVAKLPKREEKEQAPPEQRPDLRPPFQPPPKVDPVLPDVRPVYPNDPQVPPPEQRPNLLPGRTMASDMLLILGGAALPLLIGGGIFGLKYIRAQRVAAGKPLLLDDASMDQLLKFLTLLQALADAKSRLPVKTEEPASKAA